MRKAPPGDDLLTKISVLSLSFQTTRTAQTLKRAPVRPRAGSPSAGPHRRERMTLTAPLAARVARLHAARTRARA